MSKAFRVGPSWKGFSGIRCIVIFGASYCDVGYSTFRENIPPPSSSDPLGIKFPGITYNEEGLPNWVGHLITKYSPAPRFDPSLGEEQDPQYKGSPLLVYDYGMGGQTVDGVVRQVEDRFLPTLGRNFGSKTSASWDASNSLFITWVGINDCGRRADPEAANGTLFVAQDALYQAGARNFLLVDVPPIHRSPAVRKPDEEASSSIYLNWNITLKRALETFAKSHEDASVFLYSSFEVFENVLNTPEDYGFSSSEVRKAGGTIWVDHLHPTSKMHDIIASNLSKFLQQV